MQRLAPLGFALLLAVTTLACFSLGDLTGNPAATQTAIAAQVMTQLAPTQSPIPDLQSPVPATPTFPPPTSDLSLPTSDFTPCSGYSTDPFGQGLGQPAGYGPWASRLLIAFSDDGLTFTRANQVLADQADVPDAITAPDGEVRVYFVIMCPEEVRNQIVAAVSRDGVAWAYKKVTIAGTESLGPSAVDPTVELTPEGRYRLYFTSFAGGPGQPPNTAQTYSAISDDGFTFALEEGVRFAVEGQFVLDPTVLLIGEAWHYFAGGVPGSNYHATSPDGLNFTRTDDFRMENILMANGLAVDGGYRYYGFVQQRDGSSYLRSLFTTDGLNWTVEPGNRLELDPSNGLESVGVKDPGVTRLPDGRYLMIYSTIIPGYPTPAPSGAPGGQQPGPGTPFPPPPQLTLPVIPTMPPVQITLPAPGAR